mmetsp:Transcript_55039/g.156476  ORF Transcript_55039/g.156476 Transcript_55039/m.156476 type:complete len:226 (-) Transcript_55039:436-1113(-)
MYARSWSSCPSRACSSTRSRTFAACALRLPSTAWICAWICWHIFVRLVTFSWSRRKSILMSSPLIDPWGYPDQKAGISIAPDACAFSSTWRVGLTIESGSAIERTVRLPEGWTFMGSCMGLAAQAAPRGAAPTRPVRATGSLESWPLLPVPVPAPQLPAPLPGLASFLPEGGAPMAGRGGEGLDRSSSTPCAKRHWPPLRHLPFWFQTQRVFLWNRLVERSSSSP